MFDTMQITITGSEIEALIRAKAQEKFPGMQIGAITFDFTQRYDQRNEPYLTELSKAVIAVKGK